MPTTAERQLVKRAQAALKARQQVFVCLRDTADADGRVSAIEYVDEAQLVELTWDSDKPMRFLTRPADILGIGISGDPVPVDEDDD